MQCNIASIEVLFENPPPDAFTHKVSDSWGMTPVPYSENDYDDDSFFSSWKEKNGELISHIEAADLCVFTCEGTLHGYDDRVASRNLLYMMYVCKKRFGKKIWAINQSCFPVYSVQDVDDRLACSIYKKVLSTLDFLTVREVLSLGVLNSLNIPAVLAFDCLPLYIRNLYKETKLPKNLSKKAYTLITGGSTLYLTFDLFLKSLRKKYKPKGTVVFLASDMPGINYDDARCIEKIKRYNKKLKTKMLHRRIKILYAHSTDEWLTIIKNADRIISGRFHHSIAAATFKTPYICLEANTPKTKALELITDPDNLWKLSLKNFRN